MGTSLGQELATCEPRTKIVLSGVFREGESEEWHVNNNIQISGGATSRRHSLILQKGDASPVWVVAILDQTDDGWEFDEFNLFEGDLPDDMSASDHGDALDPAEVEFIESE